MKLIKANNLACPIDGEMLTQHDKQLVCDNGHSFDLARQGYVNLLPVQHKRSKQPGDSKEMVAARSHFLNGGLYEPIANKLAETSLFYIKDISSVCLMDAGCGEGYYFDYLYHYLENKKGMNELSLIGLDISKHAIIDAAKKNNNITWVVGTNRQPPVHDESVDIILCVFGFHNFDGFNKILKHKGKVILVEAGAEHLKELRDIIYTDIKKTDPPDLSVAEDMGFSLVNTQELKFETGSINNQTINQMLLMTPHFFRANKEGREKAMGLEVLNLTIDVVFRTLEKA